MHNDRTLFFFNLQFTLGEDFYIQRLEEHRLEVPNSLNRRGGGLQIGRGGEGGGQERRENSGLGPRQGKEQGRLVDNVSH